MRIPWDLYYGNTPNNLLVDFVCSSSLVPFECGELKTFLSKGWQLQVFSLLIHCEVVFVRVINCFYKTRHLFLQTWWCQNMFHTQTWTLHLQLMPSVAEWQLWLNFFHPIPALWTVEDDWEAKILEVLIYFILFYLCF